MAASRIPESAEAGAGMDAVVASLNTATAAMQHDEITAAVEDVRMAADRLAQATAAGAAPQGATLSRPSMGMGGGGPLARLSRVSRKSGMGAGDARTSAQNINMTRQ